jgi:cadmium resistance protein CadD (predicted permease)
MTFLVITCIEPVTKFFGCIPLGISMIIMALTILSIAGYTYGEATMYFKDAKILGFLTKEMHLAIQLIIGIMIFIVFLVKKKCYSLLVYLISFALSIFDLVVNIYKLSIFTLEKTLDEYDEKFVRWLFFIRIGIEFLLEMMVCFMTYSMKKSE